MEKVGRMIHGIPQFAAQTWTLTNKPPVQGAIFCLAYVRGILHGEDEEFGEEHEHAVVITTETEPNFTSGEAA